MPLPTSGQLNLNQIHVEAGGTSGTAVNLNDADIRGMTAGSGRTINSSVNTAIEFSDFYGASGASSSTARTITVTQGTYSSTYVAYFGFVINVGSVSPTTYQAASGTSYTLHRVYRSFSNFLQRSDFWLTMSGSSVPSTVLSKVELICGSTTITLMLSEATTSQTSTYRYWVWHESGDFSSSETTAFENTWDGSGNVTVKIYT